MLIRTAFAEIELSPSRRFAYVRLGRRDWYFGKD